MQTFLPYSDFEKSALILDKKRCWNQVKEAKQILNTLIKLSDASQQCTDDYEFQTYKKTIPWVNHPAVKMWSEHIWLLEYYYNAFLKICLEKHKIKTNLNFAIEQPPMSDITNIPWWLGNEKFHRAMRSRLIEKDYDFYSKLFPDDIQFNNGKYFWPVMETKTFRII